MLKCSRPAALATRPIMCHFNVKFLGLNVSAGASPGNSRQVAVRDFDQPGEVLRFCGGDGAQFAAELQHEGCDRSSFSGGLRSVRLPMVRFSRVTAGLQSAYLSRTHAF
jgi:hypothetical protein